jgi:protein-S-isoprenylcysteine O-methyltransferase Ste14
VERWLPLAIIGLDVGICIGLRAWLQYARTGSSGVVLFHTKTARQIAWDLTLVVIGLTMTGQALAAALNPASVDRLAAIPWPAGAAVGLGGLIIIFTAQLQMGDSWRIGIDRDARPGLVSHGLYRWSRNPIFSGLLIGLAGYALLLPTLLSLVGLLAGTIVIRAQVMDEEQYLGGAYGAAYVEYARRVGRFVPGVGTLR